MDTRKPIKTDNRKIKEAAAYHKSIPFSDQDTYQQEFNYGQARINYELNAVDMDFLRTLKPIVDALQKLKDLPQLAHAFEAVDFNVICEKLTDAENRSTTVASIRPPGCEGPYPL